MPLYKEVREDIARFTFITRTSFKHSTMHLYYNTANGMEKHKSLPYRATRDQVLRVIETIKTEINYKEKKAIRDAKVRVALANEDDTAILGLR